MDTTRFSGWSFNFSLETATSSKELDTTRFSGWSFNFRLLLAFPKPKTDTTRFSGVELQFQPHGVSVNYETPPAKAGWSPVTWLTFLG